MTSSNIELIIEKQSLLSTFLDFMDCISYSLLSMVKRACCVAPHGINVFPYPRKSEYCRLRDPASWLPLAAGSEFTKYSPFSRPGDVLLFKIPGYFPDFRNFIGLCRLQDN